MGESERISATSAVVVPERSILRISDSLAVNSTSPTRTGLAARRRSTEPDDRPWQRGLATEHGAQRGW